MQGVGTVAAVWVALWQIRRERKHRASMEARDEAESRRSQAERVAAWIEDDGDPAGRQRFLLSNQSHLPVYEVIATLVMIQGSGPRRGENAPGDFRAATGHIPPGRWSVTASVHPGDWHGMSRRAGAEVAFTDSKGKHWIRRANGTLEEIAVSPADHYGLPRPLQLDPPSPEPH